MVQPVKILAVQVRRPEFKTPESHKKLWLLVYMNPVLWQREQDSVVLVDCLASSRSVRDPLSRELDGVSPMHTSIQVCPYIIDINKHK